MLDSLSPRSGDYNALPSAVQDNIAMLWEADNGTPLNVLRGHTWVVNQARFSPSGDFVVTASADRTARLWYARTGTLLDIYRGQQVSTESAIFSPDERLVLTTGQDGVARVYRCEVCAPMAELAVPGQDSGYPRSVLR